MSAAALAVCALIGGQVQAQDAPPLKPVEIKPSPIHAIPNPAEDDEDAAPAHRSVAPPALAIGTLNAQMEAIQARRTQRLASAVVGQAARGPTSPGSRPDAHSVAIAQRVMDAAAAFDSYTRQGAAIRPDFRDGPEVARAVLEGAGYEPNQLQQGAVAYAALVALQEPHFVQGVHDLGQDPAGREALIQSLMSQPEVALKLPGARDAGVLIVSVVGRMGAGLLASGASVKQAAYDLQGQAWSKGAIAEQAELVAGVKQRSATPMALTPSDAPSLISTVLNNRQAGVDAAALEAAPTPTVARGLALAALAVLGAAGEERADSLTAVMTEAKSGQCVQMAKLNLYQCLSAAGPHYEGAFCLGRHALIETGQCVATAVNWRPAPPAPRGIYVPVALASLNGPEHDSVMATAPMAASISVPIAAAPAPIYVASAEAAPASPPSSPAPFLAPSRWRPAGPAPGDAFVGGPYGPAGLEASARQTVAQTLSAASPTSLAYGEAPPD
jgi:hypothetical protein